MRCKAFENLPFNFSLVKHNPVLLDLLECIDLKNKESEFLAKYIKDNTEINNKIYTSLNEITNFKDINKLIVNYNNKLYPKYKEEQSLKIENNHIYINGYEKNTISILKYLNYRTSFGLSE
jgi:hypothetical protein